MSVGEVPAASTSLRAGSVAEERDKDGAPGVLYLYIYLLFVGADIDVGALDAGVAGEVGCAFCRCAQVDACIDRW